MKKITMTLLLLTAILNPSSLFPQRSDSSLSVYAWVNDEDTWCSIDWHDSYWSWWLIFDDGEADDCILWQNPGGVNAVRFDPSAYPTFVTGGEIYVGGSTFPGPFLGTSFLVAVYDDNGNNGLPGAILDSMTITVENYGWVEFGFPSPLAPVTEGSFYLGMIQTGTAPNAAPIGIDTDNPTYQRSYSCFQGNWGLSPYQDFMIRAWITDDSIPVPVIEEFEIARFSDFDPGGSPLAGDTNILDTTDIFLYTDFLWVGLPIGWYAYGVKSHYASGQWSDYFVSNIVPHLMASSGELPDKNHLFNIYPNPSDGLFTFETSQNINEIRVLDYQGDLVTGHINIKEKGQIDLGHLSNGIYFLQIQTDQGSLIKKIILLK